MSPEDESDLVRCAREGDREAFCGLVRGHERRLHALALALCRNAADAEDLSQEAWLRAFRTLGGFRGDCPFYGWVRRILLNRYLNTQRRPSGEVSLTGDEPEGLAALDPGLDTPLLMERVQAVLGCLSPQERVVLLLRHREEMKVRDIAGTLGCSTGAIKKALHRALQKLRLQLSPELARK